MNYRRKFGILTVIIASIFAFSFLLGLGSDVSAKQTTVEIELTNFTFTPLTETITVGDTVRWINVQGFHDVVSTSGPDSFSSGSPGTAWIYEFTFTEPGTYEYTCTVHLGMDGTLVVEDAVAQITETPTSSFTPTATQQPTETPSPTATLAPTETSTSTSTPAATSTSTATPVMPVETPSPVPSETPTTLPADPEFDQFLYLPFLYNDN